MLAYRDIGQVKAVFMEFENPLWALYSGRGRATYPDGRAARAGLLYVQEADIPLLDSWAILEGKLMMLSQNGGAGHIYLGAPNNYINIPVHLPGGAGVNGLGMYQQNQGLAGHGGIAEAVAKERQIWDLELAVKELQQERTASVGFLEKIADNLLESGQLGTLINGILSAVLKSPQNSQGIAGNLAGQEDETAGNPNRVGDAINGFIARVGKHFRDENQFIEALNGMADMVDDNPEILQLTQGNGKRRTKKQADS